MKLKLVQLWGKNLAGAWKKVLQYEYQLGGKGLNVYVQPSKMAHANVNLGTSWEWLEILETEADIVEMQVLNPTAGAITFSLALLSAEGAPADADRFLAKDLSLGAGGVWQWQGVMSSYDIYIYGVASVSGLVMRAAQEMFRQ